MGWGVGDVDGLGNGGETGGRCDLRVLDFFYLYILGGSALRISEFG